MTIKVQPDKGYNDTTDVFQRECSGGYKPAEVMPLKILVVLLLIVLATMCAVFSIAQNKDFPYAHGTKQVAQESEVTPCPAGSAAHWEDGFTVKCMKVTR